MGIWLQAKHYVNEMVIEYNYDVCITLFSAHSL